jgi:phosphoserine phosphatase RsbU/P
MRRHRTLLALLTLTLCLSAFGQTVDLDKDRLRVAPLPTLWRFHVGDNPAWADPKFDDSGWSLLKSDRDWYTQGYKGYSGMGWYRFRVVLPSTIRNASIVLPDIYTSFEIFADGVQIGTFGKMPPHGEIYSDGVGTILYAIPSSLSQPSGSSRPVTVAIRVWMWPGAAAFRGGGPDYGAGMAGDTAEITNQRDLTIAQSNWQSTGSQVLATLQLFAALIAFSLFLTRPKEQEYFWFSMKTCCSAISGWIFLSMISHVWNIPLLGGIVVGLSDAINLLYLIFFLKLLKRRRSWFFTVAALCILVHFIFFLQAVFFRDLISYASSTVAQALLVIPPYIWIVSVILATAFGRSSSRSQQIDARLLLLPIVLQSSADLYYQVQFVASALGSHLHFINFTIPFTQEPFPISVGDLIQPLFLLSVFAILVIRFARTRSEQERFVSEIEGARSVQQFLIPDDLPKVPGLTIESDYRPAREVGGDFFQIIPNSEDGSALIFVGDVAGKGMQAGMLATLLVGAMRTAATFTRDPAIILATLNNRLHGKGQATCVALRIESDGAATLVNAGHLPPYLNGIELPMEGALPLGTIPNLVFPVLHFRIGPDDTVTLISDGILEAQKPNGELFGFERITQHLAANTTASSLATAAQNFGQEDDITVLTISRVGFAV